MRFFLDEGVPNSVGLALEGAGHEVIYLRDAIATGSPDPLVCAVAEENEAILVALDGDMRQLAQRRVIGQRRFRRLSLVKLSCRPTRAAKRTEAAISLLEHEWSVSESSTDRRLFVEISDTVIRTFR